ncbi:MAG TPA: PLP-dependent aminotransferase family protein [Steroidobacteraceae bacterium]|nr:PLP-dependent aminotransferase family protein [Steroidobacteraceae bacterium]
MLELSITLPPRGSGSVMSALHRELRAAILDGRLKPGLRLPSTRLLAHSWGVSRNTVMGAYDLLLSEGYLCARHGAGTYVAISLPVHTRAATAHLPAADPRLNAFWRAPPADLGTSWASAAPGNAPFRIGVPDAEAFPFHIWRRLLARSLRALAKSPAAFVEAQGRTALREAIAHHASFARAVACEPDDVVVTSGTQQAFELLAKILVTPGETSVAFEDPGYPPLRAAFIANGARIIPAAVDSEGLVVDSLPAETRLICVTPSHQFPLGVAMSMRRRAQLLEFARRSGAVVIEDDYDGEFRFGSTPRDALQTLDRSGSVFYVGTFSKSLFPGIRLGFVVVPRWARHALIAAKQCADWHSPVLEQDALAAFIGEGHMARHVRKMRKLYGERRTLLVSVLQGQFAPWLEPIPASGGMHLTALERQALDWDNIAAQARELGLDVRSLRVYCVGSRSRRGLVLGYGGTSPSAIRSGLSQLRRLFPMDPMRPAARAVSHLCGP